MSFENKINSENLRKKKIKDKIKLFREKFKNYSFVTETSEENDYIEEPSEQYIFKRSNGTVFLTVRIEDIGNGEIVFFGYGHTHFDDLEDFYEFDDFLQYVQDILDDKLIAVSVFSEKNSGNWLLSDEILKSEYSFSDFKNNAENYVENCIDKEIKKEIIKYGGYLVIEDKDNDKTKIRLNLRDNNI